MPSFTRTFLPLLVLRLLEEERELWAYRLAQLIRQRTQGQYEFKEGTLYPLLHSLEQNNLIEGEWRQSPEGPERRYYRLTDKGGQLLVREQIRFEAVANIFGLRRAEFG